MSVAQQAAMVGILMVMSKGVAGVPAAPLGPSLLPPLNFPERGPRQAPWARREARFGAGTYCSKRRRTGAAHPLGGTRTSRTPRNLRWKANQRSTIHRSQRRWRPRRPPVPSRPDGGSARRPSDTRAGRDTKPGRGRSTRKSKRGPGRARCTNRYGRWERRLLQARWAYPPGAVPVGDPVGIPT